VLKIYKELGVASLDELEKAAKEDRLKPVKGLGAALQAKVLQGIEIRRKGEGQRHLHRAAKLLDSAQEQLRRSKLAIEQIVPAGDFRRGCELVGDLALVVQTDKLEGAAPRKLPSNSQLSVWLTDKRRLGGTLISATGSQKHVEQLRELAVQNGMALDEQGLHVGRKVIARKEEEIYAALGLQFIEPELREGLDEIELAKAHKIPRLVSDGDIRGILHAHTDRSDGVDTLAVMAEATKRRGYEYFGVADHSRSAHYARGLSIEEIAQQHTEIDNLNQRYGGRFRVFKGIESDLLADGSLDYPDEVLTTFDFVVASVHSRFKLGRKEQTERIRQLVASGCSVVVLHHSRCGSSTPAAAASRSVSNASHMNGKPCAPRMPAGLWFGPARDRARPRATAGAVTIVVDACPSRKSYPRVAMMQQRPPASAFPNQSFAPK
jgi:DNA polymerase (family 10)